MISETTQKGQRTFLRNLRIGWQMRLVAGMALAGFLAIALISVMVLSRLSAIQAEEREATDTIRIVEAARYDFLDARRREKDFLIRLDGKSLAGHAEVSQKTIAALDQLSTRHDEPETLSFIKAVRAGFEDYVRQFAKVADQWRRAGFTPEEGLQGALRGSVHDAEERLKAANAPELTVLMLMMRRHEKDFLARLDAKYVKDMAARAKEFEAALAANPAIADAAKGEIRAKMAAYQRDFAALAPIRLEIEEDIKVLSRLFAEVEPKLEAVTKDTEEDVAAVQQTAQQERDRALYLFLAALALASLVVFALTQVIGGAIAQAVSRMADAMKRLAARDMTVDIPARGWRNEIGGMAAAVQVFKENMIEADRLAKEQRREQEARAERAKRIEDLCKAFDATSSEAVKSVAAAASEMQASSQSMGATAEETTRQAAAVAAASEQASANVQTVASASEELASSISEISRQVTQASQIASAAVTEAERANVKVQGLAQAANKIGEVVALITDIAEQTNLLALNATIEAARAGDAGKGFAVVASEVKNLANQTAKATDEIGAQITGIQAATREAVSAIEEITKTISKINEVNSGVASAVEEQGAATQEIARNVEQAAAGTQEVSANIGGVSQAANETGAAAEQIRAAATALSQQSETLHAEVNRFLVSVRAA
ncbi:methyl-accepting chemotaxis protein [Shumkonia mesophila]|uniref:methyl-accepting chemotaxis protein n=1 Tax=Shumkonia mesophila TaxID=2838854 RepID=UPI0029350A99|nr:methyl-accepting chemotaxis protein [Shumkonia mesophila]